MKKLMVIFILSGSVALAACNTIEGAGRDVQSVGNAVSEAAD